MPFQNNYVNLVAEKTQAHTRLIRDYDGTDRDFDFIIVGSGMGGGILADDLADRFGQNHRILVLDAGSFIYPTHVYNLSRVPNFSIAAHFDVDNFTQNPTGNHFIGGKPQLAFGGRSIFWSGLIPQAQDWELDFFPDNVRQDLTSEYFNLAADRMNVSFSLGAKAKELVQHFRNSSLNDDFVIQETPRALHQPYLNPDGTPRDQFFVEPTGVFNTAELLISQVGLTPGANQGGSGLFIKLNCFVEAIDDVPFDWYEVRTTNTATGEQVSFYTPRVVIAAGSIESPKLINRSSIYQRLPDHLKQRVGFGLTDHPVTAESQAYVSSLGNISLSRRDHAKIIFYSRGKPDQNGHVKFPFNIEMNVNHEYWHLRNNDPSAEPVIDDTSKTRVDIKFSFANCLDDANEIKPAPPFAYVPEISFGNLKWMDRLRDSRFPAVAGWQKSYEEIFEVLNRVTYQIFSQFSLDGQEARPVNESWYGSGGKGFGWGTVHHAAGSLRMPYRPSYDSPFAPESVVDEDLRVIGTDHLYVCDMSVMPISSSANPVRTLVALALRLSKHFG